MEYIKKEDLIEGEIYTHQNGNIVKYQYLNNYDRLCGKFINKDQNYFISDLQQRPANFTITELKLATSEEKHWFETCITANKFITFDEAMKSFIPEYVECVLPDLWKQTIRENGGNLIFKSNFESTCIVQIKEKLLDKTQSSFKPSTKKAYDTQFVVKEPEFVLPEKWCVKNIDNLIGNYFDNKINFKCYTHNSHKNRYLHSLNSINQDLNPLSKKSFSASNVRNSFTEITFEQFKKYVLKEETIEEKIIEPLPQFKVIETIETITKVENNEGNQFFIGDKITIISGGLLHTIKGFKYLGGNMVVITDNTELDINDIEHYIEPKVVEPEFILPEKWCVLRNEENYTVLNKWCNENNLLGEIYHYVDKNKILIHSETPINSWNHYKRFCNLKDDSFTEITFDQFQKYVLKTEVKEETLLDKAKRLYPVGTKFKSATTNKLFTVKDHTRIQNTTNNICFNTNESNRDGGYYACIHSVEGKWATIIK